MMLCLIRQANSVVLEVEIEQKAKGQECLDKVCQMLGIIEVDYFGLQYSGHHGELLWLNLRNPVKQQLAGAPPYRLHLKVKFCVPPHLLLQETTRHQFFLNLMKDFQDGKLRVNDRGTTCRLLALIAQSELGNLDISGEAPSSLLVHYAKWLPGCLSDHGNANQVSSPLLARKEKRRKHHSGASEPETSSSESEDMASSPPCEHGFGQRRIAVQSPQSLPCTSCLLEDEFPQMTSEIMQNHRELRDLKPTNARYLFLKDISDLEDYGVEYYLVRSNSSPEELFYFGVGPKGVNIVAYDDPTIVKYSISYSSIHIATHSGRCLFLTFIESNGDTQSLGFKCDSGLAANAIYRAVTEKHAFYSCETVRNAVTSQFIRDLKGTIVSLFNENSALGKNYVFDIRRTCREVYDHTRRTLYQLDNETPSVDDDTNQDNVKAGMSSPRDGFTFPCGAGDGCTKMSCNNTREKLASLQDSMLCRICMDADVCTAFFPCRHVVCCSKCSPLCDICPLCRTVVQTSQHIYLPVAGQPFRDCDDQVQL